MTVDQMVQKITTEIRYDLNSLGTLPYDWIDNAQEYLDSLTFWAHLEAFPPYQFALVPPNTTGTADFTNGANTIQGHGTAFTSAMVNQVVQRSTDDTHYWITAVDPVGQVLTLAAPYIGTTTAGSAFTVHTVSYTVPATMSLFKVKSLVIQDPHRKLIRIDEAERDEILPNLLRYTGTPRRYCDWGQNQIQVVPPPDAARLVVLRYQQFPTAAAAAGNLDWPPQMHRCIELLAIADAWRYLADDREDAVRSQGMELAQQHVQRNNVKSDYFPRLRRFDEAYYRSGFMLTYPRRITFTGGIT